MAWHYLNDDLEPCTFSPGPEEESLLTACLDTYPSALSKLMPTQEAFCLHASGTDYYQGSQFGMTFAPLTDTAGAEKSILLPEDSPVRTLVLRERAQELKDIEAGFGRRWRESFAKLAPDLSSWKTLHCSLFEESPLFLGIWPRWGMMQNGECWERLTAAVPMSVPEFGLLPTPRASVGKHGICWKRAESGEHRSQIEDYLGFLSLKNGGHRIKGLTVNPGFQDWLMGWPEAWTDLKPLETVKFLSWRQQHGES